STTATVSQKDFFNMSTIFAMNTLQVLGMMQAYAIMKTIIPITVNYTAFMQMGMGLNYLDAGNWAAAYNAFWKCYELDPTCHTCAVMAGARINQIAVTKAALLAMSRGDFSRFVVGLVVKAIGFQAQETARLLELQKASLRGGGSCFAADTRVLMADNTVKRIIDIKEGDMVISRDVETGKNVIKKVTGTKNGTADSYYLINGDLKVAPPHPFYMDDGRWVKIADLAVGDDIRNVASKTRIESIEEVHEELKIYNIFVEDLHNFYVLDKDNNYFLVKEQ
ncbi:MAG: hypothetical protein KAJ60_05040, partial [Desulfobulbaceae bacterium]|nr:hypothetical protein [Desulfobulbaceae bacterium]